MIIKPRHLSFGDWIGIVAPASPPPKPAMLDQAVAALERLGFKVRVGKHATLRRGFLAGSDQERAADLMKMFADRKVRGIFCVRGGYGSGRLLDRLDYDLIRAHPKVLVGYSDLTALGCALLKRAQLVTFHGPMAGAELIRDDLPAFTLEGLLRTVMEPAPAGSILAGAARPVRTIVAGSAEGRLVGGNLTLLCSLLGTPYEPVFRNGILFLEEVGEAPYRIDRLLTQLLHSGRLRQVRGIAVGCFDRCDDPKAADAGEYRQTVEEVVIERLSALGVPLVLGLPFGHVRFNATLPLGVTALLDGVKGDLVITSPAVL